MSTITKEFTKEQLQQIEAAAKEVLLPVVWSEKKAREHFSEKITPKVVLKLARIALASLEAETVGFIARHKETGKFGSYLHPKADWFKNDDYEVMMAYTAPPVSVAVPQCFVRFHEVIKSRHHGRMPEEVQIAFDECAAMIQGTEPVTTANKLPDDFDFDRFNDVVWLEAVASNPHMHSPTTSTIAMVALELNKKLADGKPELTVWYGSMPESNGKANWTAILHRKGEGRCMDGFTIDRSEYPGRVLYAADRVRYLIGEKSERPRILDYDADAHSGYVKPGNSPVIPDGWVACSERMPENLVSVLVTGTWFHHAVAFWDGLSWCDLDFEQPVTHWMPLPAAPQQEVKS